jgi:hypothetical protein
VVLGRHQQHLDVGVVLPDQAQQRLAQRLLADLAGRHHDAEERAGGLARRAHSENLWCA